MNNKGQTLALFIVLLPIVLFVFMMVCDLGIIEIQNRKINNVVKTSIKYSFSKSLSDDEIKKIIIKNIDDINYDNIIISREDGYITITINKKLKVIFNVIKYDDINVSYTGIKDDNNIIIDKK